MSLAIVLMFAGSFTNAAEPQAKDKSDAKDPPGLFRASLPAIRQKALLDCERQSVADLERWFKTYEIFLEAGIANLIQHSQIEEELQHRRIRALRLDANYQDTLDQLSRRFHISEQRRRQIEDAAIAPLTKLFQRYEAFSHDWEVAMNELTMMYDVKDVARLRPGLLKLLAESALVKNTALPKRFLKSWDEWKKIDDSIKAEERVHKNLEELRRIRKREIELEQKQAELPQADRQRSDSVKFEVDLGEFQRALLICEKQAGEVVKDEVKQTRRQRAAFNNLRRRVGVILDHAYIERQTRLDQSWPGLAPLKIKDVDLLACKWDKAEGTIASLLKSTDAQRAGGKKARHIRSLAESYPIQQRLFQIAFMLRGQIKYAQMQPDSPQSGSVLEIEGHIVPTGQRPNFAENPFAPEPLLKREAAFKRARNQLLQTWIDYQMVRLDLHGDLGLSPSEK